LKGAFMFYSDLVKLIKFPHRNDFIKIKTYSGLNSTGELQVETELKPEEYVGKSILIVEDMHDTGNTLKRFIKVIETLNPKRIDTAVLVKRPDRPV
jgi:hypoxanthine phosphoribosyltransferase